MSAQEQYERQLYQLSQRLTLQNQLIEQEGQARQYQQQLTATRQALAASLESLSLSVPDEGAESASAERARKRIYPVAGKTGPARYDSGTY